MVNYHSNNEFDKTYLIKILEKFLYRGRVYIFYGCKIFMKMHVYFTELQVNVSVVRRPGSHPPPQAPGQPVMMNGGNIYNNMYPAQSGYYGAPGQAFYPTPQPAGYAVYPPPGTVLLLFVLYGNLNHNYFLVLVLRIE